MNSHPLVSVIIVNYNGQHHLAECLPSLLAVEYPSDRLEIIVVDNGSKDDSVVFIRKKFPQVILIEAHENLGFTGGNNLGFSHARGQYLVLLNSDTIVDRFWLQALVTAASSKQTGIVTSKLLYHIPFIRLSISSSTITKGEIDQGVDFSPVGVVLEDVQALQTQNSELIWYESGVEHINSTFLRHRATYGNAHILLPLAYQQNHYRFIFSGHPLTTNKSCTLSLSIGQTILKQIKLEPGDITEEEIILNKDTHESDLIWLVQNAGNTILHNGYGKDRGSILRLNKQGNLEFYDFDTHIFQQPKKVASMCGASCLIKREVIDQIGFLDGHYFMYYEDVEFSIRCLKMGWDIQYEPKSVVYHKHRATTGKSESAFFLQMIERNHLALLITHFPWQICMQELARFFLRLTVTIFKAEGFRFRDDLGRFQMWKRREQSRIQVLSFLVHHTPRLLGQRWRWMMHQRQSLSTLEHLFY